MPLSDPEILAEIYNNCDPIRPADKQFYVDCYDVRGGDAFVSDLCKELRDSRGYVYQLFAGHIGGGKSSELNHLAETMEAKQPSDGKKRFFPVIVNVLEYVEENNATIEYILLGVVEAVSKVLRDKKIADLTQKPLPSFLEGIKSALQTPLAVKEAQVGIEAAKITFASLRTSPSAREEVTKAIRGNETSFRKAINDFLEEVRQAIRAHTVSRGENKYTDFVLILDGMDRLLQVEGKSAGSESHKALFIDGFDVLINLDVSAVYTAPLSLVRSEGNTLSNLYTRDPYVLPMVKTEKRGKEHAPYQPGRDRLTQLLQRRMPLGVTLPNVIADDALNELLYYSGGHIRSLLRFMREACLQTNDRLPISLQAARKAIAGNVGVLAGGLNNADYDLLAELEHSDTQEWDNSEERPRQLLEQAYVYEYVNGSGEDFLNSAVQWYAVNPIVRGLNPFKRALERLNKPEE